MHSNVTIKNVSWPHFSRATLYVEMNLTDNILLEKGRSQEFNKEDSKGDIGDGSPPAGSRGRARVRVWGEAPRSRRQICR